MQIFDLTGKVALVTGGNGGIGLGIAAGLAEAGATVVINGRNREKNAAALATLRETGGTASALEADLRDPAACRNLVDRVVAAQGRIDILVNNSGINFRKPPQDFTLDDWHAVIDTNLTAPFLLCQAVYPHFQEQGGGKIINIGSIAAFMGSPVGVAYAPSKGGITQMSKALAVAWAPENIQVNTIQPGWIDTPLSQGARAEIPGLEDAVIARTPAGRWGTPGDFAGAAVFLASSAADFVNGAALVIDGAYSVKA
ncbi:glucose 1-dehydrogenase [Psychromarinibacter sp. C21-152]|uniref:Glucose 1-dehydrogenase n=1 Tax=Psychromarinibacter sediminicola TaxID=3033385 RepID=A0AAE3NQB0_9RHOB|nr:glucose 1-dehydrogenase [Psychromarinibacter sediminicola]MDF0600471.1 glucose 1-dehydrogenase [Psychromarinibacter sediminicola]